MLSDPLAAFARTTGTVLEVPTLTFPKFAVIGKTTIGVTAPIPVSATVCGEFVELSAMVSVAVSARGALGLKKT